MVKFRKKTHRKINKKSKRSIKGGARYYCREGVRPPAPVNFSDEPPPPPPGATQPLESFVAPPLARESSRGTKRVTEYFQGRPVDTAADESAADESAADESAAQQMPKKGRTTPVPRPDSGLGSSSSAFGPVKGTGGNTEGGTKRKRKNKKKKTRKARGIMDDLRTLCTTGRCGSPTPQTPTLREVALTIERNMIEDFNTNSPEKTLTAKDRRNIKILANHEAARIVNTSSSASKKKKKKKKKKKRNL